MKLHACDKCGSVVAKRDSWIGPLNCPMLAVRLDTEGNERITECGGTLVELEATGWPLWKR